MSDHLPDPDPKIDACVTLIRLCDQAIVDRKIKLEQLKERAAEEMWGNYGGHLIHEAEANLAFAHECLKKAEWLDGALHRDLQLKIYPVAK